MDPVLDIEAASANPQRWFRYSYALNGPLRHSDPDGREVPVVINGRFYNSGIDGTRVVSASEAHERRAAPLDGHKLARECQSRTV